MMMLKSLVSAAALLASCTLGMVSEQTLNPSADRVMSFIEKFSYTQANAEQDKNGISGSFELSWKYEQKTTSDKTMYMLLMYENRFDEVCTELKLCNDLGSSQYASKDAMCKRLAEYKKKSDTAKDIHFYPATNKKDLTQETVTQHHITQSQANFWYWYWIQCDLDTEVYTASTGAADIKFQAHNNGRGYDLYQFSTEYSGLNYMYAIYWTIMTVIVGLWFGNQYRSTVHAGTGGLLDVFGVHHIVKAFSAILVVEWFYMTFAMAHYVNYASDGVGLLGLLNFGQFLDLIAQVGVMFLVLCVAKGWTITTTLLRSPKITFAIMGVFTLIYMILYIVTLISLNPAVRQVTWELTPGVLMMILRVLMFVYFLWEVRSTYMQEDGQSQLRFYQVFAIGYGMWFMAIPIFVIIGACVDYQWRQKTIESLMGLVSFAGLIVMGYLLRPRENEFFRLSGEENNQGDAALPYDSI